MADSGASLPTTGLELRSTVTEDGRVTLAVRETAVRPPGDDEVVVRVEAAPINPSDLGMLFAGADLSTATAVDDQPHAVSAELGPAALAAQAGRLGAGRDGLPERQGLGLDPQAGRPSDRRGGRCLR